MNKDLIKQAEVCLSKPSEMHSEHEKALYVLRDCVTEIERLSKPYVPMNNIELNALDYSGSNIFETVQNAVIARYDEQRGVK